MTKPLFLILFFTYLLLNSVSAQDTGYMKFDLNVDSALLVVDYNFDERRMIASGDSVEILAGSHNIDLSLLFSTSVIRNSFVIANKTRNYSYKCADPDTSYNKIRIT